MKIAFIIYAFPVLSETFILNQITGLIDRGHDVHIFCKGPYRDKIHHADVDRYNLIRRTNRLCFLDGSHLKKLRPINEIKGYIEIGKQKDYMCNIS